MGLLTFQTTTDGAILRSAFKERGATEKNLPQSD